MTKPRMRGTQDTKRASNIPNTPVARRRRISELLMTEAVRSQSQLEKLLAASGLEVTQATLSRDLEDLGAVKIRDEKGILVYAVPGEVDRRTPASQDLARARLARKCSEVLVSAESSENMVVLKTPPGAANFLAYAVDGADLEEVIGTVAGDDTVLLITRESTDAADLVAYLTGLAEGVDSGN